jgi:ligand-binding sensor domain-containing protein/signal transduction histidine kinase
MACALFAIISCFTVAVRADQLQSFTQRTWQMSDGLPEQIVQAFAQTQDRYLWVGTSGGLLRFDGAQFVLYSRDNVPAFTDNNIFCLTVSNDGSLWIGSEGGGLIRYRDGKFQSFSSADGLLNFFVRVVFQDSKGQLWVGTDNGLLRVRNERLERVDNTASIPALAVHAIYEDDHGGLWVGGSRLLRLDGNAAVEYRLQGDYSQNRVKSIVQTRDGVMWVGTVSGLQKMLPGTRGTSAFTKVADIYGTVRFLRQTVDGALWIGTIGNGIYVLRDGQLANLSVHNGLPSNTALNLFEDAEKNIWIGTQAGMLRLSKTAVNTVRLPDAAEADAGTIFEDTNGDLWVASAHLFRVHDGTATRFETPGVTVRIRNAFRDSSGALWIGTEGQGAVRFDGKKYEHYTTQNGLVNNFVRVFVQGRDGSVWIATDEGVTRWRPGGLSNYQMRDGLCYFSTRSMLQDRHGDIWIGTDRGVSRLHDEAFQKDAVTEALREEKIWAIHEDSDGGLWFGTRTGGLYRWRSGKLTRYTAAQGLASNSIYEILEDKKYNLWLSGPSGISVVSRRELDEIADKGWRPIALTLYGVSEGLEKTQLYGGEKPAGVLTSSGEVWFPSNKGPVRVTADQSVPAGVPPVVVDRLVIDGVQVPGAAQISLGPDNVNLEIHYSVILLRSQERVRFRYKLEGFDSNWVDASARRVAYYTNLPPGQYRLRIAAFEMNNPAEFAESSISILKKPHFYRTKWFLSLCLLLLAGAVWGIYRLRVTQLRYRFNAVLKERARLAREMHDTLIQGCTSTSALLEAYSSMGKVEDDGRGELLDTARTQLRSTINDARQAVWDLRHQTATSTSVVPLLKTMAAQVRHDYGVPVEYSVTGEAFDLEQSAANELLMIVREALYNAVRHGSPGRVLIATSFEHGKLLVTVQDDGCGFDPESVGAEPGNHYGLIGMKERVRRIGGKLAINSRAGAGTEVKIQVPRKTSAVAGETAGVQL